MPRAKKLPSGSWRCQVCKNGVRKSFTVQDPSTNGRRLCERLASEWAEKNTLSKLMTVEDAVRGYIRARREKMSPTTIVSYESMLENAFGDIKQRAIISLDQKTVQRWVDEQAGTYSAKSVRNQYALLNSAVSKYTGIRFRCELPQSKDREYETPTDEDISLLIKETDGTEIGKAILLSAFGSLREGECSALRKEDINGNEITVRHSMAWDGSGWVMKAPKNFSSERTIILPEEVIKKLQSETDFIVNLNPREIAHRYEKVARRLGLKFRFHDLRAYAASVRHFLGIPDAYIQFDGGWKTDVVLKRVYRRTMEDKRKEFAKVANDHFLEVISHADTHEPSQMPENKGK